jgi:hypothetical protein
MFFPCPACSQGKLKITLALELPPGSDDDELTLQTVECGNCGLSGIAVYRENRRGNLQSESWRHEGYLVGAADLSKLQEAMKRCPAPQARSCKCATHAEMGKSDWANPEQNGIEIKQRFEMRIVPK